MAKEIKKHKAGQLLTIGDHVYQIRKSRHHCNFAVCDLCSCVNRHEHEEPCRTCLLNHGYIPGGCYLERIK